MQDPYVYPNTRTLKNRLSIKDPDFIRKIEADYTSLRLRELTENPLTGCYDLSHLKRLHRYLFQDLYDWAGEFRRINIEKEEPVLGGLSVEYADHNKITEQVTSCLQQMTQRSWHQMQPTEFAQHFCFDMASLWKIHPFREGNTRTVITFCCQFAENQQLAIRREIFEENSVYMRAALVAYNAVFHDLGDLSKKGYLERIVQDAFSSPEQPR